MLHIIKGLKNIREFKQTHLQIFVNGLQDNNIILAKLIDFSSTFHSIDYAIQIFQNARSPSVFVYNTMMKCLNERKRRKEVFCTFNQMNKSVIMPNTFTFTFLLKSCESNEAYTEGTEIHTHIVKLGFGLSVFVQNTLLDFYSKCSGDIKSACQVFEEMLERDVVSWNSMIGAYMTHGDAMSAIRLFDLMPERNVVSWNSVVAGLSKTGDMDLARAVFERMPAKNTVSWNSLIFGYLMCNDVVTARSIFEWMVEKNVISWTAMISGYMKVGEMASAIDLFNQMPVKNVVSWNAMISGYIQNRLFNRALQMFHRMLIDSQCRPNEATLISVLSACTHLGALEHGNWVASYMKKNKFDLTIALGNSLIDMFAKCGDMKNASIVFDQMTKKCIITWTAMVLGLAVNGQCHEALALFDTMCRERVEPDDIIFIAVLSACSHGGLVEDGYRIFDMMVREFHIKPRIEHYGCMIDLLGRAGKLEEAIGFIKTMPMEPSAVIWATLLGSCKINGNGDLVEFVTRKLLELEPSNPGYRVLISNSNASIGRWKDVLNARASMRQEGIEKVPGCSLIQVGDGVHEFLVKDTRHEQRMEIYEALDGLTKQLKATGYVPCTTQNSV